MSDHWENVRLIRHSRYLDLGDGSNKFWNHYRPTAWNASPTVCPRGYATACSSKPTFAECKIVLEGTPFVNAAKGA